MLQLEVHEHVKVTHGLEQAKRKVWEESQGLVQDYQEKELQYLEAANKW